MRARLGDTHLILTYESSNRDWLLLLTIGLEQLKSNYDSNSYASEHDNRRRTRMSHHDCYRPSVNALFGLSMNWGNKLYLE